MEPQRPRAGLILSATLHLLILAALLFGLSPTHKFEDAQEAVPVTTITTSQFVEIMNGEKDAKPAKPPTETPAPKPAPPPPPPPPEPPSRPEPEPAPPPPAVPEPPPPPPEREEVIIHKPPRPIKPPPPKPTPKPKPVAKPKPPALDLDKIARELAHTKPTKRVEKPSPHSAYDPDAILKSLEKTSPKTTATQGLANHHAARMSERLDEALSEWLKEFYDHCWSIPPTPPGENYMIDVRVSFKADGSLAARPVLINPPADPHLQALAESAIRAVLKCDPLHVPEQYLPYFDQWHTKIVHFVPPTADGG